MCRLVADTQLLACICLQTHLPMMTSAAMRPCRLAGPASGMRAGCSVTQSWHRQAGRQAGGESNDSG